MWQKSTWAIPAKVPAPALLVGNPTAQTGRAARWLKRAQDELAAVGIACEFMATEPHGKTVGNVSRHIDTHGTTLVIAMGGASPMGVASGARTPRLPDPWPGAARPEAKPETESKLETPAEAS